MKEYIEKVIEIILDNVSCEHQEIEEHPRGPKFDNPTYGFDDAQAVIEKCLKVLPTKSVLTKEFIERKAIKLHQAVYGSLMSCDFKCHMMIKFREQIRMIFEEE
jgi:hypothetical protein